MRSLAALAVRASRRVRHLITVSGAYSFDLAHNLATNFATGDEPVSLKTAKDINSRTKVDMNVILGSSPNNNVPYHAAKVLVHASAIVVAALRREKRGPAVGLAEQNAQEAIDFSVRVLFEAKAVRGAEPSEEFDFEDAEDSALEDVRRLWEYNRRTITPVQSTHDMYGPTIDLSEDGPLGPLWHVPSEVDSDEEQEVGADLVFEIEVPEDATDEDIKKLVGELALHADGIHRACGGNGLKIDRLEIDSPALVPVGVPRG